MCIMKGSEMMGIIEVDAKGLDCPEPVIKTKKALDKIEEGTVVTYVDNKIAKDNVMKLAKSAGFDVSVDEKSNGYAVTILKGAEHASEEVLVDTHDLVILIKSAFMGEGDNELGALLMKNFLYAVSETSPLPEKILFINGGVRLTVEGSESLDTIKSMADQGVVIESCGICLDFFHLKEKLAVGSVTNMYSIVETLSTAKRVLTL